MVKIYVTNNILFTLNKKRTSIKELILHGLEKFSKFFVTNFEEISKNLNFYTFSNIFGIYQISDERTKLTQISLKSISLLDFSKHKSREFVFILENFVKLIPVIYEKKSIITKDFYDFKTSFFKIAIAHEGFNLENYETRYALVSTSNLSYKQSKSTIISQFSSILPAYNMNFFVVDEQNYTIYAQHVFNEKDKVFYVMFFKPIVDDWSTIDKFGAIKIIYEEYLKLSKNNDDVFKKEVQLLFDFNKESCHFLRGNKITQNNNDIVEENEILYITQKEIGKVCNYLQLKNNNIEETIAMFCVAKDLGICYTFEPFLKFIDKKYPLIYESYCTVFEQYSEVK